MNVLLIYSVLTAGKMTVEPKGATVSTRSKRKFMMTKTIIILTISFIVLTLPGAVISGYYFVALMKIEFGPLIINICDDISFSYHALSIITLYLSNKQFSSKLKFIVNKNLADTSVFINGSVNDVQGSL